jgi:hypothetical protein
MKEAFAKATGLGLLLPFEQFAVELYPHRLLDARQIGSPGPVALSSSADWITKWRQSPACKREKHFASRSLGRRLARWRRCNRAGKPWPAGVPLCAEEARDRSPDRHILPIGWARWRGD